MPYYKKRYFLEDQDFPETLLSFSREISLPLWPGMKTAQTEQVIETVKTIAKENAA
jgi:dTDP-4-amino-4,6-dideoxygalactose transaminase